MRTQVLYVGRDASSHGVWKCDTCIEILTPAAGHPASSCVIVEINRSQAVQEDNVIGISCLGKQQHKNELHAPGSCFENGGGCLVHYSGAFPYKVAFPLRAKALYRTNFNCKPL